MNAIPEHYYKAFFARDRRYDGVFYTGVTSTGVYCRPVCRARKPKRQNCVFFHSAAEAEQASFRPCLLCRPELAPGLQTPHEPGKPLSERQQRRRSIAQQGITPTQLARTKQLLLAKQLLADTQLAVTDIAFAAGFGSVRRFNEVIKSHYQLTPSDLRRRKQSNTATPSDEWIELRLGYRPPYRWDQLLGFLRSRMIPGVEAIDDNRFARSLAFAPPDGTGQRITGEIAVSNDADKHQLKLAISSSLIGQLPQVLQLAESVFDTGAQPQLIAEDLVAGGVPGNFHQDGLGLRVPGSFSGFELAVRAVLGQQVTIKAATTLARRFCQQFSRPYAGLHTALNRLPIEASVIAATTVDDIASLGIIARRAKAIIELAQQVHSGHLLLQPGADAQQVMQRLQNINGIGPWTANYIALRSLAWPDAWPKEDIVLRKALGNVSAKQALELATPWRPWRSYACLYLWALSTNKIDHQPDRAPQHD